MKKLGIAVITVSVVVLLVYLLYSSLGTGRGLMLHCGAGIRPAADALIEAFEAKHDVKVSATYDGSGRLLGQISAFHKGDLFMPGAELYVDKAIEKDLAVAETRRIVAHFVPVIFVRKGNPRGVASLRDLGKNGLRVGLGDERSCAVGKKTLKILEKNGIPYSDIEKNVVHKSATVNELGLLIQLGNADAVILWDANARHFADHGDVVPIPPDKNIPSTIPIVLLKSSEHPEEARAFIDFVTSEEGRKILTDRKYTVEIP
jgi:molybdate transport system substrate-binding protein